MGEKKAEENEGKSDIDDAPFFSPHYMLSRDNGTSEKIDNSFLPQVDSSFYFCAFFHYRDLQ